MKYNIYTTVYTNFLLITDEVRCYYFSQNINNRSLPNYTNWPIFKSQKVTALKHLGSVPSYDINVILHYLTTNYPELYV